MALQKITSSANAQVKQLVQLQKKARQRTKEDVFIVEGIKMYQEVPKERLMHTYVSESFYQKYTALFEGNEREVTLLDDHVFAAVSDTQTPQGVLCLVRQYHYELEDLLGKGEGTTERCGKQSDMSRETASEAGVVPLIMALENLQDPGNLGTILRTAEGAGVTGILLSDGCVDLYNPKVIRSTMGSVYRMPFYYASDFYRALEELKRHGVIWYAAHLRGEKMHDGQDYRKPTGFLIGNESRGLSDRAANCADAYIRIPMCGQVESLNAAVASAILMYEANRQRRQR